MRISDWSSDVCSSDLRNLDDAAFRASDKAAEYGRCLSEIFEAWLAEDNEAVHIKFIDQTMVHFRRSVAPGAIFKRGRKSNQVVIARSDGTVAIDDSYIPALDWYSGAPVHAMESHSLRDFLGNPIFEIGRASCRERVCQYV